MALDQQLVGAPHSLNILQQNKLQKPQPIKQFAAISLMKNDFMHKYNALKQIMTNPGTIAGPNYCGRHRLES